MSCDALNSKSTFEDIQAAYNDSASYTEDADIDKAKRFITACRLMLNPTFLPRVTEHAGERTELFLEAIERQIKQAIDFVVEGGLLSAEEVVYLSFEKSRS